MGAVQKVVCSLSRIYVYSPTFFINAPPSCHLSPMAVFHFIMEGVFEHCYLVGRRISMRNFFAMCPVLRGPLYHMLESPIPKHSLEYSLNFWSQ